MSSCTGFNEKTQVPYYYALERILQKTILL